MSMALFREGAGIAEREKLLFLSEQRVTFSEDNPEISLKKV